MMANQALTTSGGSLMEKKELGENLVRGAVLSNKKALENSLLRKEIEEGFDVVIVYTTLPNDVGVYLANRMGAQLVLYCSGQGPNPFVQWAVGQPFNPAYQTFNGYVSNRNLSFFQRVFNTLAIYLYYIFRQVC